LLVGRTAENGITEIKLISHLRINATLMAWLLKLAPDATAESIELWCGS
jgi:hypothetical protein